VFILNGGLTTLEQAEENLSLVDGVMLGREVYHNPYILADVDSRLFADDLNRVTREEVVELLIPYIQTQLQVGVRLNSISRHVLGLFHGAPGARGWRRYISEHAHKPGADENVILEALRFTAQ